MGNVGRHPMNMQEGTEPVQGPVVGLTGLQCMKHGEQVVVGQLSQTGRGLKVQEEGLGLA